MAVSAPEQEKTVAAALLDAPALPGNEKPPPAHHRSWRPTDGETSVSGMTTTNTETASSWAADDDDFFHDVMSDTSSRQMRAGRAKAKEWKLVPERAKPSPAHKPQPSAPGGGPGLGRFEALAPAARKPGTTWRQQ